MPLAALLGLGAAAAFGTGDLLAGLAARRIGTIRAAVLALAVSAAILVSFAVALGWNVAAQSSGTLLIVAIGVMRAIGFLALVEAFRLGPLSIVSTISAAAGAFSVFVAVLLLGEHPDSVQWLSVPISTLGVAMIAFVRSDSRVSRAGRTTGPAFALISLLLLSIAVVAQTIPIREFGWEPTLVTRRLVELAVTVGVFVAPRVLRLRTNRSQTSPGADQPIVWDVSLVVLVLFAGILDTSGISFLAAGLAVGPAWLVGLASSVSPLIAIAVGVVVFHERPRPRQWFGMGLVAVGLVMASIG
jgi:drug/metabolite transporter (DMT)-like permease